MLAKIILIIYLLFINFMGIASMASDKIRVLLFHHKTRKAKFRYGLPLILLAQIGFIILLHSLTVSIVFI